MQQQETTGDFLKFWFNNARPKSLPQSLFPALLALSLAYASSEFSLGLGLLSIIGVVAGHLGLNLFDDYFDYKKEKTDYRESMAHEGFRARVGKCLYLTSGKATMKQLLFVCCTFSALALLIGTVIFYYRGSAILYLAMLTAVLGLSYSGSPVRFSYRGMGEILLGLIFGPMIMVGVYYSATGIINTSVILISIPVGLLVSNMLYVHSMLDFEPDKKIGKRTLAVLLNDKRLMLAALFIAVFSPYVIIVGGIFMEFINIQYVIVLLTLPMAISLFLSMKNHAQGEEEEYIPRVWMGPMTDWSRIQAAGIDWFMIRWYLARNLLTFFCIFAVAASFLVAF